MQAAMLAEQAAELPATRWATIAPNYKYGQDAVAAFRQLLGERRPEVEFVTAQWPALFQIDAGAEVQALLASKPEAIFNVTFGTDLAKFVREGELRGLFEGREVVSQLTGEPEYLDPLGEETPKAGSLPAIPGTPLTPPSTGPSSRPIRNASATTRGSVRWSATIPFWPSPRSSERPAPPTPKP
jgi:branched-chain amino acid transport system substrate-binding protein